MTKKENKMIKQFNLDFTALKSASYAMSTDETRYYLCGVHIFEREGSIIYEATNGHILIRVVSEVLQDGDCAGLDIIFPAFLVKELSKPAIKKGFGAGELTFVPCVVDATRINIEMIDGLINFKLVDGTYPDTDKVIPKKSDVKIDNIGVSAGYMDKLSKSVKSLYGSESISMNFTGDGFTSPILIQNSVASNWLGVLMPLRI